MKPPKAFFSGIKDERLLLPIPGDDYAGLCPKCGAIYEGIPNRFYDSRDVAMATSFCSLCGTPEGMDGDDDGDVRAWHEDRAARRRHLFDEYDRD